MTHEEQSHQTPLLINLLHDMIEKPNQSLRNRHKVRVFHSICDNPGITRKELIALLELRPGTVSELVQELVKDEFILESAPCAQSERGRPEIPLHPNWMRWVSISVFCVSMELRAVLINSADQVLADYAYRIPSSADNADIESLLTYLIRKILNKAQDKDKILGISLSVPGIVDSLQKEWVFSARWPRLRRLSLKNIQEHIGIPLEIRRQLDVQLECAILQEPKLKTGNTLLFHWGSGIGGAFASEGSIISSNTGIFCQIGHVSVHPESMKPCICGRIGCLETDAALWALAPDIERTYGIKPENEVDFVEFLKTHEIADKAYFRHALTSVAHALSHLQAILVPNYVLMYGSFLENEQIFNSLIMKMKQLSPPLVAENITIKRISMATSWGTRGITLLFFREALQSQLMTGGITDVN